MRRNLLIFERTTIDLDWQRGHSACEHAMLSKVSILAVTVVLLAASSRVFAQQAETSEAFGKYVAQAEARIAQERNSAFLRLETLPAPARAEMTARLRRGDREFRGREEAPAACPARRGERTAGCSKPPRSAKCGGSPSRTSARPSAGGRSAILCRTTSPFAAFRSPGGAHIAPGTVGWSTGGRKAEVLRCFTYRTKPPPF